MKRKLIRVAASPISLDLLLKGQLNYLNGFSTNSREWGSK